MDRQSLTRDHIVRTSIVFVDEYGLEALTMRRLGEVLEVAAMALYRHVSSRGDLLEAMVSNLIDSLLEDDLMTEIPTSWEDYLQRAGNATRQLAEIHPEMFPLIATQPSQAPWLRPPLRSLRWVEGFLSTLESFGFSDEGAVAAYKSFTSFLVGDLLLQVHSTSFADVIGAEPGEKTNEDSTLARYPTVKRLRDLLGEDQRQRDFDNALDDLIERVRTTLNT